MDKVFEVVAEDENWLVRSNGHVVSTHSGQQEAVDAALEAAAEVGGEAKWVDERFGDRLVRPARLGWYSRASRSHRNELMGTT